VLGEKEGAADCEADRRGGVGVGGGGGGGGGGGVGGLGGGGGGGSRFELLRRTLNGECPLLR